MRVVETDQHRGRRYRCPCGALVWTVWGRAQKHHQACPRAHGGKEAPPEEDIRA